MSMMRRRNFISLTALFMASCASTQLSSNSETTTTEVALPTTLRLSVTDEIGLEPLEAEYNEFRLALAEALGVDVEFVPVEDQVSGALLLKEGKTDLALGGPSEYVVIQARTNAVPVVALTRQNYYSVLATTAESGIQSVADLRGKAIALADIGSTSGHLGPIQMLTAAGLDPQADVEIQMLGDEGSITALHNGEVEAWGGSAADYGDLSAGDTAAFPILEAGSPLPHDIFIVSSQVKPAVIELIREKMLANQEMLIAAIATHQRKYTESKLQPVKDSDYDLIRAAYKAIGQGEFLE